jgi:hypothetical protein
MPLVSPFGLHGVTEMRFRTTYYQTVSNPDLAPNATLDPTPGQVGVIDTWPGSDTNVQSDYSYQPEAAYDSALSGRGFVSSRRPGRTGRNPFSYVLPNSDASVDKGAQTPQNVQFAGAGRNTGAPTVGTLETGGHGPFNPVRADGAIPTGAKAPVNRSWWRKLLGIQDQTGEHDERLIPQTGATGWEQGYETTPAALGENTFIVPDIRATFDTPGVAGVGTRPDGMPYVAKAGRPTEDPWFDPQEVTISNTRWTEETDSPAFLPDRTKAGAADPRGSRPSQVPQWFTFRKFDQNMAQHMSGVKGVVRNPLAGRPIATSDESASIASGHTGQHGYHYTSPAPGMSPSGPMPNTVRQVPGAWDADLNVIDTGSAPRTRGFRRG